VLHNTNFVSTNSASKHTRRKDVSINTREPRVRTDGLPSQESTQTLSLQTVGLKSTLNSDSASTVLSVYSSGFYLRRMVILNYFFLLQSFIQALIHSSIYLFFLFSFKFNPLNPELNPICYLLALLGTHHFLHLSMIRVKSLTFRRLISYIYMEHPFLMFLGHTQRRSTVGRTPLDE